MTIGIRAQPRRRGSYPGCEFGGGDTGCFISHTPTPSTPTLTCLLASATWA